jgi:guanylate kinase
VTVTGSDVPAAVLVVTGPSGVGKGTVVAALLRRRPDLWLSVSTTTRAPRPGEVAGEHYRFATPEEFVALQAAGQMLESANFAGHWYGTPAGPLRERLADGQSVVLEIEVEGARQVRRAMPQATFVFLAPPSVAELRARLRGRGTEDEAALSRRLARAEQELALTDEFDHVLVNDDVDRVVDALVDLLPEPSHR